MAAAVTKVLELATSLVPRSVDVGDKEIGDLVEDEMKSTTDAIEQAAARIQVGDGDNDSLRQLHVSDNDNGCNMK